MNIQAHAKINLCLNVVGKRSDGYHELEMIMVPLTLCDEISIEISDHDEICCDDATLPLDDSNTVVRALKLMRETYQRTEKFKIYVVKKIPSQAGLAGGSADAAAIIRGINTLCNLQRPIEELAMLGKKIGADVPFCVRQVCADIKGIGEMIEPFDNHCDFQILLVKPKQGVSTKEAFAGIDFSSCVHPNCQMVKDALLQNDFHALSKTIGNTLEQSAFRIVPAIEDIKHRLQDMGFLAVLMSGSGSSVFALTQDETLMDIAKDVFLNEEYFVCRTKIL